MEVYDRFEKINPDSMQPKTTYLHQL